MTRWTEGLVHVAMRRVLRGWGWQLIAGEFPGGSDHELYPLNVVDPEIAFDNSPDPRRHSLGEKIPDIVALRGRDLLIGEAKLGFDLDDQAKLEDLLTRRRADLLQALEKFGNERGYPELLPVSTLAIHPVLIFLSSASAPVPKPGLSHLLIDSPVSGKLQGALNA